MITHPDKLAIAGQNYFPKCPTKVRIVREIEFIKGSRQDRVKARARYFDEISRTKITYSRPTETIDLILKVECAIICVHGTRPSYVSIHIPRCRCAWYVYICRLISSPTTDVVSHRMNYCNDYIDNYVRNDRERRMPMYIFIWSTGTRAPVLALINI